MNTAKASALVDTDWLAAHISQPHLRVVDASFHLPGVERDAYGEYLQCHLPGAVFFDIDHVCDRSSPLPHMLPEASDFAREAGQLGFTDDAHIVVYDVYGIASAPRLWWMLRVFGHARVSVLDGGLAKWLAEDKSVSVGPVSYPPGQLSAKRRDALVADVDQMLVKVRQCDSQVVDVRPPGRFAGRSEEPRPGLRLGHMPGATNLPWTDLLDSGVLKPPDTLARLVEDAAVDRERPMVATCGSGVTACILALAMFELGTEDVAVYDGSWAEWGSRGDTPVICDHACG
jgi:thiosulfate/3-mercaptopyruvate sulfurtransferase